MALDGLEPISAAAGDEAAARTEQRREPTAINTNQSQHHLGKPTVDGLLNRWVPIARYDG